MKKIAYIGTINLIFITQDKKRIFVTTYGGFLHEFDLRTKKKILKCNITDLVDILPTYNNNY